MKKNLLVIGAHSGDFVWRASGTIARSVEEGASTLVIAMSYGERGESGELWKEDPKRSVESVKVIRHEQAQRAADILGTPIRFLDWGDYPMLVTDERVEQLTNIIGDFEPSVILTHSAKIHLILIIPWLSRLSNVRGCCRPERECQAPLKISILLRGTRLSRTSLNCASLFPIPLSTSPP